MAAQQLDFYFDCSSPWTYLGFERAVSMFANKQITIHWKPILVGGLFNTINPSVYYSRENPVIEKLNYADKDLQDWAKYVGIKIEKPDFHPVNSVKAMRGAFVALEHDCLIPYARAVFQRYWGDCADISQTTILTDIAQEVGLAVTEYQEKITAPHYKDLLRQTTQELADRGGFGSPTMFLNGDDMYFGNDRLELIVAKL